MKSASFAEKIYRFGNLGLIVGEVKEKTKV